MKSKDIALFFAAAAAGENAAAVFFSILKAPSSPSSSFRLHTGFLDWQARRRKGSLDWEAASLSTGRIFASRHKNLTMFEFMKLNLAFFRTSFALYNNKACYNNTRNAVHYFDANTVMCLNKVSFALGCKNGKKSSGEDIIINLASLQCQNLSTIFQRRPHLVLLQYRRQKRKGLFSLFSLSLWSNRKFPLFLAFKLLKRRSIPTTTTLAHTNWRHSQQNTLVKTERRQASSEPTMSDVHRTLHDIIWLR